MSALQSHRARWGAVAGAILALALVVRLGAGYWWQERLPPEKPLAFGDSESYWYLGQKLARGESFEFGSPGAKIFRTPGYPVLLAMLFRLLGDDSPAPLVVRSLSAICGTTAVAAVMGLAWRMFGARPALLAGLVAAVHPEVVSLGVFILSEAPFHPLLVLNILCVREAWLAAAKLDDDLVTTVASGGRRDRIWALLAGVTAGLATLMRPSWLLFLPYFLVCGSLTSEGRSRVVRLVLPLLAGLCVVMAPWWWRNFEVTGRFVPTTLQVGASLYDGWHPEATGASDMRFTPQFIADQRAADAAATGPLTDTFEERLDRRHRDAALQWASAHAGRVLELMVIKLGRMWSPLPNAREVGGALVRLVTCCAYVPLMGLAVWHTVRRWRTGSADWIVWLPAIYLTNLHVIFVSSLRYRQPALLPLIALAVGGLGEWWWRRRAGGGA